MPSLPRLRFRGCPDTNTVAVAYKRARAGYDKVANGEAFADFGLSPGDQPNNNSPRFDRVVANELNDRPL